VGRGGGSSLRCDEGSAILCACWAEDGGVGADLRGRLLVMCGKVRVDHSFF
jgi:hypothetical protein